MLLYIDIIHGLLSSIGDFDKYVSTSHCITSKFYHKAELKYMKSSCLSSNKVTYSLDVCILQILTY